MARYPEVLAGNRITAQLLDSMLPDIVIKPANETVTSSTTLQNDDDLFVSVEANAQYDVFLTVFHDSEATSGDIKFSWTGPSGATMNWGVHTPTLTTTSSTTVPDTNMQVRLINEVVETGGADNTGTTMFASGSLTTSSTAGTLQLQWAQQTSNATASTVRAGSKLHVRRVA